MVRAADIQEKLLHLIGWEQNYDTSDFKISDALTVSESGIYFQQIHPLLTLQNMSCIAPDFKNIVFQDYDSEKEYNKGSIVSYNNKLYKLTKGTNVEEADIPVKTYSPIITLLENSANCTVEITYDNRNKQYKISIRRLSTTSIRESSKIVLTVSKIMVYPNTTYTFNDTLDLFPTSIQGSYYFDIGCAVSNVTNIYDGSHTHIISTNTTCETSNNNANIRLTVYEDVDITVKSLRITQTQTRVTTHISPDNSEYWIETDPFSEWLEGKTKASIQKAIARFCNEKIAQGTYKTLCESKTLFDGTGRLVDVVKNKKNLVGFEIIPIRAKGVTTKINKIGLQFTEPGEYTLYLMHSSMDAPIKVIKLNKLRKNSIEWFSLDNIYLPYQSDDNDAGGSWYLCYFQSELPEGSHAIRKDKDWSKEPCSSCSRKEYLAWMAWSKYIEVHPFFVNEELVNAVNYNNDSNSDFAKQAIHLWNVENNQYTYDNNYGLNLELTISCDITDFIIEQRMLFQDIIAKQVAVDMLREFAYNANVRTNRHSINASRLDILYEVDGDSSSMKKSGLSYQLDMAFKAIKISTSGIDRVCLPCKNNGIKYRTV